MFCQVYRSGKKPETYVYLPLDGDVENLPKEMSKVLAPFESVMTIDLAKREKLARAKVAEVIEALNDKGFYLQMPPPPGAAEDYNPMNA